MLFDLRGRGRRRTVQVIYLSLAILMGGGLVLFGIGGATPGGLVDAVTGTNTESTSDIYKKRIERYEKQTAAEPKNAQAWANLTRAYVQEASVSGLDQATGQYTKDGIALLQKADVAWQKHLDLDPEKPDGGLASLMVNAYAAGALNDPDKGLRALEAVIAGRGPSAALYSQVAVQAYAAGDTRKSVLAERRAVELSEKDKRKLVKARIAAQRKQIDKAKLEQATGGQEIEGIGGLSGE
jgi:tetratricopeptide (TPR) repeat protein